MDDLCNALLSCNIEYKPVLYDMMIFDFIELSKQYINNCVEYTFEVNPEYEFSNSNERIFNKYAMCALFQISKPSAFINFLTQDRFFLNCLGNRKTYLHQPEIFRES